MIFFFFFWTIVQFFGTRHEFRNITGKSSHSSIHFTYIYYLFITIYLFTYLLINFPLPCFFFPAALISCFLTRCSSSFLSRIPLSLFFLSSLFFSFFNYSGTYFCIVSVLSLLKSFLCNSQIPLLVPIDLISLRVLFILSCQNASIIVRNSV